MERLMKAWKHWVRKMTANASERAWMDGWMDGWRRYVGGGMD